MVVEVEIAVCVDYIFKINSFGDDFIVGDLSEVATIALAIELRRIFRAGNAARSEREVVAFHVGVSIHLERFVGAATEAHRGCLEIACRGIEINRVHIGEVGRWCHREHISALVSVVFALYYGEFHLFAILEPPFAVCHVGDFAHGESVNNRDGERAYTRFVFHVEDGSIDIHPVGIRSVEHHHLFVVFYCGIHEVYHRNVVGVETESHILDIHHEDVKSVHHLLGGFLGVPVIERGNGYSGFLVNAALYMFSGIGIAAEAMLGRENCSYIDTLFKHNVEDMLVAHHACVVAEQRHLFALEQWYILACASRAHDYFA